ncbi:Hypothetical predicted protein [Cloeon dipterum]|uniref:tRNA (32-2'-O)-methyltransferase regulator THADA n=1 Tax=Cloeon dipterum TaxID=197152 RepID=A0A8S1CRS7_9INSE|nr:Hypothetical predicted protein [Cloeon dipterum]
METQFPRHCQDFYQSLQTGDFEMEFSHVIAKTKLFQLVCSSASAEEILQEMREISKNPKLLDQDGIMDCFFALYLLLDYQGHVKNAFFKLLDQKYKSDEMCVINIQLFSKYIESARATSFDQTYAAGTVLHVAKSLPFAAKIILPCWSVVFQFLHSGVQIHRKNFQDCSNLAAIEQQIFFSGLHILTQATVAIFQVANKSSSFKLGRDDSMAELYDELVGILNNPPTQLPSDTINSCAMALILCYDRLHEEVDNKDKILEILRVILSESRSVGKISKLTNCSIAVKFSLSAALLGVYNVEELSNFTFEGEPALLKIFEFLSDFSGRSSESSVILSGCRAIAALGKLLPQAATMCPELSKFLLPKANDHCVVYLEHHMDSVRHATKAFLSSLLSACQNNENLISEVACSFKQLPSDSKAKFFGVAALGNHVGATIVLHWFPNLVEWLLLSLKDKSLAPHASSTLESLMQSHIDDGVSVELWCNTWITPVITLMPCPELEPVLSKAVQIRPQMIPFIVDICSAKLSTDASSSESTNHLKILLSCLKMAKKHSKVDPNTWMEAIGLQHLTFALCHSDDDVRLAALAFITESRRITEPLNAIALTSLLTGFKYCGDTDAPATCHAALSILKKLFARLASSIKAVLKNDEGKEAYLNFACQFCNNAFSDLFPGSSLCRRSFSLQALILFRDTFSGLEPWSALWHSVLTQDNAKVLMGCLTDSYEANKTTASDLLKSFPASSLGFNNSGALEELLDKCVQLAESHRPPDCTNAACVLSLIVSCKELEQTLQELSHSKASSCLIVSQRLINRLELQLQVAKKSILKASDCGPMYGTLFCIRSLILIQDLRLMSSGTESHLWKLLIKKLIGLCFEMNATVAPIVNSSSPEGHLPMDFETDLPGDVESLSLGDDDVAAPRVTAQMVLLCAWRTVKEVSLTLGDLAAKAPASSSDQYLLSNEQLLMIGEHFTALLCETKHRGAFEQAYVGFCKLCAWLWKVPSGELPQLPSKWLDEVMSSVAGKGSSGSSINLSKLCTTRRSAGVPFIVQALITTELEVRTKPECFHKTVTMLLVLAKQSGSEGQLHALNILRALFRSAHLGEHVAPYVSEGFIVAINAFKSSNWAERNAATLLFSSLMSRVFGVKHTPGHEDLPRKNRMTGRIFFRLYPDLFGLLSSELQSVSFSIKEGNEAAGSLYPVLLLLARLYPSSLEGTDSALNLLSLLDYVSVCTASPVMHTRVLAAKALVPLVEPQQAHAYILSLNLTPQPQNSLHGILLQLSKLIKEIHPSEDVIQAAEMKVKEGLYLLQPDHKIHVTKGAFIEFVTAFAAKLDGTTLKNISETVIKHLPHVLNDQENQFGSAITKQNAARLWLRLVSQVNDFSHIEEILNILLQHPLPDVVHEACNFIVVHTSESDMEINGNSCKLLGLKISKNTALDISIKTSRSIAQNVINTALKWTPKNGQQVQFESRIIIYLAAIRLSKCVLEAEWNANGQTLIDYEDKLSLMLNFCNEGRLGPANFMTLALAGQLLHRSTGKKNPQFLESYASSLLKCAMGDSSCESNVVVAQSLCSNKNLIFSSSDRTVVCGHYATLIILQQSSFSGRDIILQLEGNFTGVTKSRALEAVIRNFVDANLPLELKLFSLLIWSFGHTILEDIVSPLNTSDDEEDEDLKVFDQGEVDTTKEELKLAKAAASGLLTLLVKNSQESVRTAVEATVEWIPFYSMMKHLYPVSELRRLQFRELENTCIFNFL